ncbi:MAG: hypothetical protein GY862_32160 [Gammaproteobacteria bacterium]|nr:hypothetical protein [Gammaproteobacteria bacterium]
MRNNHIEELLMNALVHRDYFIHDSIKLFVFEDRIEIKSPGKLPNGLSVKDIKLGIQRRSRNIILTSFVSDILPYRGIGSGILKSLKAYPHIDFENNSEEVRHVKCQIDYAKALISDFHHQVRKQALHKNSRTYALEIKII